MASERDASVDTVSLAVERELTMIRAAIELVASGGSPRVVLAGLRFLEPLLAPAQEIAAGAGVRIVPLWTAAERATDLAIEATAS